MSRMPQSEAIFPICISVSVGINERVKVGLVVLSLRQTVGSADTKTNLPGKIKHVHRDFYTTL